MRQTLCVAVGGGIGAVLRFLIQQRMQSQTATGFPWGTLTVNLTGAFAIGLVMTLLISRGHPPEDWRLFAVVGILGGYTTFSSLAWEMLQLARHGLLGPSLLYVGGTVVGGFAAVVLGVCCARLLASLP